MSNVRLTDPQRDFVELKNGNVLVSASAGSGKTFTMIQKLVGLMLGGTDLKNILVVTYTNSAASEMKQRLYSTLIECLADESDENKKDYISDQIDSLNNADIGTLHSVCKKILTNYFYAGDIDPAFGLITGKEQTYLFNTALDNVFNKLISDNDKEFYEIYTLYNNKRNINEIKFLVTKVYEFCLSKIDYAAWKQDVLNECDKDLNDISSAKFLVEYFKGEVGQYKRPLERLLVANDDLIKKYGDFVNYNLNIVRQITDCLNYEQMFICAKAISLTKKPTVNNKNVDEQIYNEDLAGVYGEFKKLIETFKDVFKGYSKDEINSLKKVIAELFRLKELVEDEYSRLKKQRNLLDFSDLEHKTLKILQNDQVRNALKEKYCYIFVDEYQDINQVQEAIIMLLSSDNVNMIGDLKQSIYQFRLSSPEIFIDKYNRFSTGDGGKVVNLNHNFRSEPNILEFANYIFDVLMTRDTIGIDYKSSSRLQAGEDRESPCVVDIDLLNNDEEDEAKEAELIVRNIAKLVGEGYKYSDIAILLRYKNELAQSIIEKLKENNIPCDATYKTQLFKNNEILVIYSLLKVLNNSHDDLAMATCLKSIFCGLNEQQLHDIRSNHMDGNFYEAVASYVDGVDDEISQKIKQFYLFLEECRFDLNSLSIIELLQQIFVKFGVFEHYASFKDGSVRVNNIKQFLSMLSNEEYKYDLRKCLDYLDGLKDEEVQLDIAGGANSVKIMTIHASKGLEFPAVILGGVGKNFRINVQTNSLIINDKLGMGVKILDPRFRTKKESLVATACKYKNRLDELNEEIRLLYVALTRAKSRLVVVGSGKLSQLKSKFDSGIYSSKNYLDFILKAFSKNDVARLNSGSVVLNNGVGEFRFNIISPADLTENHADPRPIILQKGDSKLAEKLRGYFEYKYPYPQTNVAIKNTVTSILKEEVDYENKVENLKNLSTMQTASSDAAMKLGTAYHSIMQNLKYSENKADICDLIKRLDDGDLPYGEVKADKIFNAINLIKSLIKDDAKIEKEAQFVMKVNYADLGKNADVNVLVQGVIDLVIENKDEVIIVDFKTNKTRDERSLVDMYKLQLDLYAKAYEKAHHKPVAKKYLYSFELNKLIEVQ